MISSRRQASGPTKSAETTETENRPFKHTSKRLLKWSGLVVLVAFSVFCLLFELQLEFGNTQGTPDFLAFYTAGTILRHGSAKHLYDVALQSSIERQLLPRSVVLPFYHPPFEAWLFEAFARLPLSHAYLLWTAMNLAVLGLIFYLLRFSGYRLDYDRRIVWLIASFPIVAGVLVLGQDSILLALLFLLAFLALKRGRDYAAGAVLGVGLFRFEIILPFVFIFLLRKRWKLMASFFGVSILGLLVSAELIGWRGLLQYAKVLVAVGRATGNQAKWVDVTLMPSLRGFLATMLGGLMSGLGLFLLIAGGSLLLLIWSAAKFKNVASQSKRSFDLEFCLAVIVSLAVSYHLFLQSMAPLIVAAFLILGHEASSHRKDHAATVFLLVLALVPILGTVVHFYNFSVLFVLLMGLAAWCSQEISALGKEAY